MAVVPITQLALKRSKRQLQSALQRRDWLAVQRVDLQLGVCLESALDDSQRNQGELLLELREILGLYASVMETCRTEVAALGAGAGCNR